MSVPKLLLMKQLIRRLAGSLSGIPPSGISFLRIIRKSIDARKRDIIVNLEIEVFSGNDLPVPAIMPFNQQNVAR